MERVNSGEMRVKNGGQSTERIESVLFWHLLVSSLLAVLAFGTVEVWSLAAFEINALMMAVILGLLQMVDRRFDWRALLPSLPLWLLLAWALLQTVPFAVGQPQTGPPESLPAQPLPTVSFDPQATREAAAKLLALAIYFSTALVVLRHPTRLQLTARALSVFGLGISLLAIVQRLTWNGKLYWIRPVSAFVAPFGPYGNYNHFAGLIELLFPLPLAWLIFSRCRLDERIFHGVAVTLMVTAAVLSMSRAGILSIGIQLLAFGFLMVMNRRRSALPLVILVAVILLSLWIGYEPLQRRLSSFSSGASEHSVVTRLSYWKSSWRIFLDHPLTGVGLGAFPTVYPSYGSSSSRYERLEQAHNDYLQLLTDTGVVGGVIFLSAFAWLLLTLKSILIKFNHFQLEDRAVILGATISIIGIAVHSVFDFNLQIASNALLFLIVLALVLSRPELSVGQ